MAFSLKNRLLAALYPDRCHMCGELLNRTYGYGTACFSRKGYAVESVFCPACTELLEKACRPHVRRSSYGYPYITLWSYRDEAVQRLILHMKCTDCRRCHRMLGRIVVEELESVGLSLPKTATYIPRSVPLMRRYRFDQSKEILMGFFEKYPDARLSEVFYRDPRYSREQKDLNHSERIRNASMSLKLCDGQALPERILVLDDIITTGATADAAASLLYEKGVREAYFVFLASAGKKKEKRQSPPRGATGDRGV